MKEIDKLPEKREKMRLIDADALPKYEGYALSADAVARAVENAPTVDAEPVRHGHWVQVVDNRGVHFVCSNCGEWEYHQAQKYCGECGARMDNRRSEDEIN